MSGTVMQASPTGNGMTSGQLQDQMNALNDQMNAKEFALYKNAAEQSYNNSLAQTLGGLATDAGKAKPNV
jgi:hypothetical protein